MQCVDHIYAHNIIVWSEYSMVPKYKQKMPPQSSSLKDFWLSFHRCCSIHLQIDDRHVFLAIIPLPLFTSQQKWANIKHWFQMNLLVFFSFHRAMCWMTFTVCAWTWSDKIKNQKWKQKMKRIRMNSLLT